MENDGYYIKKWKWFLIIKPIIFLLNMMHLVRNSNILQKNYNYSICPNDRFLFGQAKKLNDAYLISALLVL